MGFKVGSASNGMVSQLFLALNRESISFCQSLVKNRVWFFTRLELGMFVRRSHFLISKDKTINKRPSLTMFRATEPAAMVINIGAISVFCVKFNVE